ncbi:hypothetical protein CPC08DRAFT_702752 [Agrocybe pediades]|nr:hypothetical protein CPC08DRAFT_702752 [Agrocybe pediades]
MATEPPSSQNVRKQITPSNPHISPAQAIADAWNRETQESKQRWRKIDADVKLRYNSPKKSDSKPKM